MDKGNRMQTIDYDTIIYTDLRQYLMGLLNCNVIRGRQNYSPIPEGCVIMQNLYDESPQQIYDVDGNVKEVLTRCIQLDFIGANAGAWCRQVATMWKTPYTCDALTNSSPLYCNNAISQQFVNEKNIYEDRYILAVFLQFEVNYAYNVDKTDNVTVGIKSWH